MASFLDKFKIKTAIEKNTTLDLSCQHLTTADFMELQPVYIKEMVPGESINVKQSTFTRLAPMQVPTLGRALIHNRAFFVPMRTIFNGWDEFITESVGHVTNVTNGSVTQVSYDAVPNISNDKLARMFFGNNIGDSDVNMGKIGNGTFSNAFVQQVTGSGITNADIAFTAYYTSTADTNTKETGYFNFTNFGREVLKVLQSLGYQIIWTASQGNSAEIDTNINYKKYVPHANYSLLPLFAYFKLILDWYWPSQYVGNADYNWIASTIDYVVNQANGSRQVGAYAIAMMFNKLSVNNSRLFGVNYDSSYVTSAFENPDGISSQIGGPSNSIIDITRANGDMSVDDDTQDALYRTPVLTGLDQQSSTLSQYALHALHAMTDYMKRHQLVGARALDRFYARFGISLSSEKLKRSNYIGANNIPLEFGDVMSHADTGGAALGDYGGRGLGYGEDTFDYKADDYGFFIICSSIVPQVGYYEGVDRMVMHLSPLDYWTPEFDQLGNQAISKSEVYVPMNDGFTYQTPYDIANRDLADGIYGYTPRYSEYKIGKDRMTGDFRLKSKSGVGPTSNAWNLMRSFEGSFQTSSNIAVSQYIVRNYDAAQYNRIFNITNSDIDHFYVIHNFNVTSNSPMHSLYDSYEFDSDGKTVVADVNGVKVN